MCKNKKKGDKDKVKASGRSSSSGVFVDRYRHMRDVKPPRPTNSGGPRNKKK